VSSVVGEPAVAQVEVEDWLKTKLSEWGIETLTDVQKKALAAGVVDGQSLIVSAPTSSGKTLVAEMAALSALRKGMRVLYLVSHRALADQKYLDFEARFGEASANPIASVGLSTGDRTEGRVDADLRVATYEKAIALLIGGQIRPDNLLVIADELQILSDPNRGPDIEALCAIFRQRNVKQFIALTATVENPADLAGWMNCRLVQSFERSVPLHQEIWSYGRIYSVTFGQETGQDCDSPIAANDLFAVVSHLIEQGRGPVLVFTETKKEASLYAEEFIRNRQRTAAGLELAVQLDLFSEPTDSSDKLKNSVERCVAFHTADLSAQERQVLESGFLKSQFDVCFATSTLAAGVNFPFKTIVFPKLTFQYRPSAPRLTLADYRNMSGRAGRLGLHDEGFAVLLPNNRVEAAYAQQLVGPANETLESVLLDISLRRTLLSLVSSLIANSRTAVDNFFDNTLYNFQLLEKNPKKLTQLKQLCAEAVDWLLKNSLIYEEEGELRATRLGKACAISGLLPQTAVKFAAMLKTSIPSLTVSFDEYADGLIYACCVSAEYCAERPSRLLPFASPQAIGGTSFWRGKKLPVRFDEVAVKEAQCAQAIALYSAGESERKIARATGISAGSLQRLASDVAWVLEGLHRISVVGDLNCPQQLSNQISQLSRRVRWGVPSDALDLLRVAERHKVPGVGRQRAMELVRSGFSTLQDVLYAGQEKLLGVLKHMVRVQELLKGVAATTGHSQEQMQGAHVRVAKELGIDAIVVRCYMDNGVKYETAIFDLLSVAKAISTTVVDDGVRQNVPEFLLIAAAIQALVECKTSSKSPALINKEDAWAVLQKSSDFDPAMRRVTLGKPAFDETSKKKAAATGELSLVENALFVEGVLRVIKGEITAEQFLIWLTTPGVAELERLPGKPTWLL
jgi:helicase